MRTTPEIVVGSWSYALFNAQHVRSEGANYATCRGCHKGAGDAYVFTFKELSQKARQL